MTESYKSTCVGSVRQTSRHSDRPGRSVDVAPLKGGDRQTLRLSPRDSSFGGGVSLGGPPPNGTARPEPAPLLALCGVVVFEEAGKTYEWRASPGYPIEVGEEGVVVHTIHGPELVGWAGVHEVRGCSLVTPDAHRTRDPLPEPDSNEETSTRAGALPHGSPQNGRSV
jgi:hypothetical protein